MDNLQKTPEGLRPEGPDEERKEGPTPETPEVSPERDISSERPERGSETPSEGKDVWEPEVSRGSASAPEKSPKDDISKEDRETGLDRRFARNVSEETVRNRDNPFVLAEVREKLSEEYQEEAFGRKRAA